jgi:hypothetical protein
LYQGNFENLRTISTKTDDIGVGETIERALSSKPVKDEPAVHMQAPILYAQPAKEVRVFSGNLLALAQKAGVQAQVLTAHMNTSMASKVTVSLYLKQVSIARLALEQA